MVQDVDNDGRNEILVQSMGRRVYCFDTVAPRPAVRARSEVQFYSELRLGASQYVPPPGAGIPQPHYSLTINYVGSGISDKSSGSGYLRRWHCAYL